MAVIPRHLQKPSQVEALIVMHRKHCTEAPQSNTSKMLIHYDQTKRSFFHRQMPDGSWVSICNSCFLTVASVEIIHKEADLAPEENAHFCNVSLLDIQTRRVL